MEGACGIILATDDPNVVIKRVHRRKSSHYRTKSYRAEDQCRIQRWAHNVLKNSEILFVPRAWSPERHLYKMERIDVSKPIEMTDISSIPGLQSELEQFYMAGRENGIYPQDFELYLQDDGRIGLVDFDKFGVWNKDGSVNFPWGAHWSAEKVMDFTYTYLNRSNYKN